MIQIDGNKTLMDLQRFLWFIIPICLAFVLGALVMYYKQTQAVFNNPIKVICEPTVRLFQLPGELTKSGAF